MEISSGRHNKLTACLNKPMECLNSRMGCHNKPMELPININMLSKFHSKLMEFPSKHTACRTECETLNRQQQEQHSRHLPPSARRAIKFHGFQ